jgi:hypothetical protein
MPFPSGIKTKTLLPSSDNISKGKGCSQHAETDIAADKVKTAIK